MTGKQDEFLKRLRATFKVEAAEHLQAIAAGLAEIDKGPAREARREIVERVFRAAHSLKGAARAVDLVDIEALCQSMEDAFASWKRQEAAPARAVLDALHRQLDSIAASLEASQAPPEPPTPVETPKRRREARPAVEAPAPVNAFASDATVRVTIGRLDAQLMEAEEMLSAKLVTEQRAKELDALARDFQSWKREWLAIDPEAGAMREALAPRLKALEDKLAAIARAAQHDRYTVGRLVDELLEDSKRLLLLPFSEISASFPKLVRDLCRDQGKEASLVVSGEAIEIDKRTLEEMKDPLVHLLRNCIVHGVETPAERARRAKPARATVEVAVSRLNGSSKVQITVRDDGAGIDAARVKAAALERGLISAEEAARLDEAEARSLVFRSELSTSPVITQLSGRGLGLAIVREKAEKLGGEVALESRAGAGTTFRITVPATRATFRGILVEAAGRPMVVPTAQVERALRVQPGEILTVEGRETISFAGRTLPLVSLAGVLELPPAERSDEPDAAMPVVVLGSGDQRVAFQVDAVVEEQEILVKPLGRPLSRVRNVAAATVLASGQLVPILHVGDLLKSARKAPGRANAAAPKKEAPARSILIAEDSITSRMLLKGILESAGYKVRTAVDGMEAFGLLQTEPFDLVVSDVEMPRLNGFDLTARIRADRRLAELPVVLVTALESREDRERGIDVGASAYLVKSSFDQSDLLAAIRRLT